MLYSGAGAGEFFLHSLDPPDLVQVFFQRQRVVHSLPPAILRDDRLQHFSVAARILFDLAFERGEVSLRLSFGELLNRNLDFSFSFLEGVDVVEDLSRLDALLEELDEPDDVELSGERNEVEQVGHVALHPHELLLPVVEPEQVFLFFIAVLVLLLVLEDVLELDALVLGPPVLVGLHERPDVFGALLAEAARLVVDFSQLRVDEDLVGFVQLLELLFGLRIVVVLVRVQLDRQQLVLFPLIDSSVLSVHVWRLC